MAESKGYVCSDNQRCVHQIYIGHDTSVVLWPNSLMFFWFIFFWSLWFQFCWLIVECQALVFLLALLVRAANQPADYDSDDEYIGGPRQQLRQQLINNRQPVPATGVPVAGTLDQRPSRNDAWSTRMREKVQPVSSKSLLEILGMVHMAVLRCMATIYVREDEFFLSSNTINF